MFNLTDKKFKNSTNYYKSRYVSGGTTQTKPNFLQWWDKKTFPFDLTDVYYILEKKFEHRPDLVSHAFYDDPYLWWFICQYNAVLDINSEFVEGLVLRIPTKDRMTTFLIKNVKV
jgi:hypothetical protein